MPIYELIKFKPTEAVLADAGAALAPASKFFSTVDGCSGLYFGASEEDKDVAFIVIVWDTFEHHQAVIDSPGYPGIVGLANTIAGNSSMVHVHFRAAAEPALGAPVTEIVLNDSLKPGKSFSDLEGVLAGLLPKIGAAEGCTPGTWGVTKEDESKSVLVLGWTTSKQHFDVVGSDDFKPIIGDFLGTVNIQMYHTSFKKFA